MKLVKATVDPADDEAAAEHGTIRTFDKAHCPHDEGKAENGKRDIAIGDLAERRTIQNVVPVYIFQI